MFLFLLALGAAAGVYAITRAPTGDARSPVGPGPVAPAGPVAFERPNDVQLAAMRDELARSGQPWGLFVADIVRGFTGDMNVWRLVKTFRMVEEASAVQAKIIETARASGQWTNTMIVSSNAYEHATWKG